MAYSAKDLRQYTDSSGQTHIEDASTGRRLEESEFASLGVNVKDILPRGERSLPDLPTGSQGDLLNFASVIDTVVREGQKKQDRMKLDILGEFAPTNYDVSGLGDVLDFVRRDAQKGVGDTVQSALASAINASFQPTQEEAPRIFGSDKSGYFQQAYNAETGKWEITPIVSPVGDDNGGSNVLSYEEFFSNAIKRDELKFMPSPQLEETVGSLYEEYLGENIDADYTPQELRKLRQANLLTASTQEKDNYLYGGDDDTDYAKRAQELQQNASSDDWFGKALNIAGSVINLFK